MAAKKNRKGHKFLRRLMMILNLVAVMALLLAYAASYISPDRYWFFAFFGLAYPYLITAKLILCIILANILETVHLDFNYRYFNWI